MGDKRDAVCEFLSDWIVEATSYPVLWKTENDYGYPVFEAEKKLKAADIYVRTQAGDVALVVREPKEVHAGIEKILELSQLGIAYKVDGIIYHPAKYLLATPLSPQGHLFPTETDLMQRDEGSEYAAKQGQIPMKEYLTTGTLLRSVWYRVKVEDSPVQQKVGVGFLLSSALTGAKKPDGEREHPGVQDKTGKIQSWRPL